MALAASLALGSPAQDRELSKAVELVAQRDFAGAEALLSRILEARPGEADALNLRGVIAGERGALEEARGWFDKAIRANPKLAGAHVNLGHLQKRQGDTEGALQSFRRAAELAPGDPEALLNVAVIEADRKEFEKAGRALLEIPADLRTPRHWEVLGRISIPAGNLERAEQAFVKVLEAGGDSVETLRVLSGLALKRSNQGRAFDYIARARKLAPNSAQILFEFGHVSLANGYVREAALAFRRAILMDGSRPEYYGGLIESLMRTMEFPLAGEQIEKYLQLRPDDAWGHFMKGQLFFLQSRQDEAAGQFRRSSELDPRQVDPVHYLGRVSYEKGDYEAAARYYRRALELNADHAPTRLRLGMLLLRTGDAQAAEKELRRAAALDPSEPTTHLQLSLLLGRTGRAEESARERELYGKLKADEEQRVQSGALMPFTNPK